MAITRRVCWIAASSALVLSCAWKLDRIHLKTVAAQTSGDPVIYLNQGWTPEIREGAWIRAAHRGTSGITNGC